MGQTLAEHPDVDKVWPLAQKHKLSIVLIFSHNFGSKGNFMFNISVEVELRNRRKDQETAIMFD